jgi:ATP phosphoribosyltransferase regulatory subunit
MEAIKNSDGVTLEKNLTGSVSSDTVDVILELTSRVGKYELLEKIIEKFPDNNSLKRLAEIYQYLKEYDEYINFDFSLLSYGDYYNGVTFQAFVKGIGQAVIAGGRYTEDVNNKSISSVGFGIEVNSLISKIELEKNIKKVLIAYDTNAKSAYEKAAQMSKDGYMVTMSSANSLEGAEIEGKQLGCELVLFF